MVAFFSLSYISAILSNLAAFRGNQAEFIQESQNILSNYVIRLNKRAAFGKGEIFPDELNYTVH